MSAEMSVMLEVVAGGDVLGYYNPLDGVIYQERREIRETELKVYPRFPQTELYLMLTEACNMNCPSCAVGTDRMKSEGEIPEHMTPELLTALLEGTFRAQDRISRTDPTRNQIKIKYAGGEPLFPAGLKLIEHAQGVLTSLKEQYPEINFQQLILTNGLLLNDKVVGFIKKSGMFVSVSLWGLDGENDKARGMREGFGSADIVLKGVQRLVENDISFNINHVVSPENAGNLSSFVERMWNTGSSEFVGNNWNFPEGKRPIPVAIQFLRPQTHEDMQRILDTGGVDSMVTGLKEMFATATELLGNGINVPGLQKLDYLQPFGGVTAFTCGSGINYIAAGPNGVANCHEGLYGMTPNLDRVFAGEDLLDIVNKHHQGRLEELTGIMRNYDGIDPRLHLSLALHGGGGCPRAEGLSDIYTKRIYAEILPAHLAFEATRQKS